MNEPVIHNNYHPAPFIRFNFDAEHRPGSLGFRGGAPAEILNETLQERGFVISPPCSSQFAEGRLDLKSPVNDAFHMNRTGKIPV